jgi:hypothetical protein
MKVTFRTHSISPGDHRSSRGSGPAVPDEVLATTGLGGSARQMSASVFQDEWPELVHKLPLKVPTRR